jgi:cell division protein FtsL
MKWFSGLRSHMAVVVSRNVLVVMLLLVMVEACAMSVIYTTYKNRALFSELEKMRDDAEEMQVVWHQLLLEQSTLDSFNRVADIAQKNLKMNVPDPRAGE